MVKLPPHPEALEAAARDRLPDFAYRYYAAGARALVVTVDLPVVLKGVLHPDDARRAVAAGVDAIVVSNHGARQLDGELPSARALPGIVSAVGQGCEVYVDSGIRRGVDVLRALALGARAVLVGRPYLWALALHGEAGVAALFAGLGDELRNAMVLCGQTDAAAVEPDIVVARDAVP